VFVITSSPEQNLGVVIANGMDGDPRQIHFLFRDTVRTRCGEKQHIICQLAELTCKTSRKAILDKRIIS
jgi:hypothetical protein